jgi:REP element-mobilizing transposase RayT
MTHDEKNVIIQDLYSWIDYISTPIKNLNNWKICPFANNKNKIEIVIVNSIDIQTINSLIDTINCNQVTIITQGTLTPNFKKLDELCEELNATYLNIVFLPDHPESKNFISEYETGNKKYSLIIAQEKEKLMKSRDSLLKTDYYSFWSKEYFEKIMSYGLLK